MDVKTLSEILGHKSPTVTLNRYVHSFLEHKRDIARALYFGQRKEDITGAAPRRTMGGIIEFLENANVGVTFDSSTLPLTYRNFDSSVAAAAFRYGSKEKLLIAGPYLASAINNVRALLDCDVILGGYVGAYLEPYLEEIRKKALMLSSFDSEGDFIKLCSYKREAIAAGAALHYISEFIKTI